MCMLKVILHLETTDIAALFKNSNPGRVTLNEPTGDFFYDPWVLKPEYEKHTCLRALNDIPLAGEMRVMTLAPGETYRAHADIDDRYHVNISGENSYLFDLTTNKMHKTHTDNTLWLMDAGRIHSAANFGSTNRVQLVIRKLLVNSVGIETVKVRLEIQAPVPHNARYQFDNFWSPKLNHCAKHGMTNNFKKINDTTIEFETSIFNIELFMDAVKESPLKIGLTVE